MQGEEAYAADPYPSMARRRTKMTAGSEESQTAAPYGRALWDADKKSRLFAAVVKTTEMAKGAGLLERTKDGKSEQTLRLYARLARSRVDVTTADGGRLMDGVTAQSWHTVRAAVLHQLAEEYRSWRKVGDRTPDFAEAVKAAQATRQAAILFDKVSKMERPARGATVPVKRPDAARAVVARASDGISDRDAEAVHRPDVGDRMPASRDRARRDSAACPGRDRD